MARNEFGVESSDSGGFGAGVGTDFEEMFAQAENASVVDDEVSEPRNTRRAARQERVQQEAPELSYFDETAPAVAEPVYVQEPEFTPEPEPVRVPEPQSFGFEPAEDLDTMFAEAENASLVDDEVRDEPQVAPVEPSFAADDSFDGFDSDDSFDNFGQSDSSEGWVDPAIEADFDQEPARPSFNVPEVQPEPVREPEPIYAPEPVYVPEPVREATPEPVYYEPTPVSPVPSVVPEPAPAQVGVPMNQINQAPSDSDVDYIERVILTSDAIRELEEADAKAVNMFITAGQPVESHQELVLTALFANRQILKTAEAILSAKGKSSVDRAFYILGLDDATFEDFGKILSHDLESTETVIFEGDRLQYARKLVDVVEELPAVSIKRFEAVQSVLGAGELDS